MAALESTIVATAMPGIVSELGGSSVYSWVFTSFLLAQAVSIPLFGRLADAYGRKLVFRWGTGLFLIGSALCGFAPGIFWLIAFRALQGFGAGGVQPIVMTICGDLYNPVERAMVQGLISSVFGLAAVAGPSLGAVLVEFGAWPMVFWIALPIGIVSIVGIETFLHEPTGMRPHKVDVLGAALLAVGAGAALLLLVEGRGLPRGEVMTASVVAAAGLAALVVHETRTSVPVLPFELWRERVIGLGSLANGLASAVMMGVAAFLPAYVQGVAGGTPVAGGLVLGAMSLSWAAASVLTGRLIRHGSFRGIAVLGAGALVAGSLELVACSPSRGLWLPTAGSLTIGFGMGLCNTVLMVAIQKAVNWEQRAAATSSCLFARFVGQTAGAAGFGAILNATLLNDSASLPAVYWDDILNSALRGAATAERDQQVGLVAAGMRNGYWLAVALSMVLLVVTTMLPRKLPRGGQPPHD